MRLDVPLLLDASMGRVHAPPERDPPIKEITFDPSTAG
jgi:hypothetical protein